MKTTSDRDDYDVFARFYDLFYENRFDDLPMYRDFARAADGPILELGCGTGRLLVPLALAGHRITGIDMSPPMLALAQKKAELAGVTPRVELVEADMRDFQIEGRFTLAFLPINTFMHCHDVTQQLACLESIRRHMMAGGQLVVDVFHPDYQILAECDGRLVHLETVTDSQTGNLVQFFLTRRLDRAIQTQEVTYTMDEIDSQGGLRRTLFPFTMRFVYRYEMELLLRTAGFSLETIYGSFSLDPFDTDSEHMIFVARNDW